MFSGLVEQQAQLIKAESQKDLLKLTLKKSSAFCSLKEGESISVNGVCMTLEYFDEKQMRFSAGPETLKITGWTCQNLENKIFNLERSLTLQSAIGGHLVMGHVDGQALVQKIIPKGESKICCVQIPKQFKNFFCKKGFITLDGVSLTVNSIKTDILEVCLIPATLKRTNLCFVKEGDSLNFEVDYMSRLYVQSQGDFDTN